TPIQLAAQRLGTVAVVWNRPRPFTVIKTEPGGFCSQYGTWLRQSRFKFRRSRGTGGCFGLGTERCWVGKPPLLGRGTRTEKRRHCGSDVACEGQTTASHGGRAWETHPCGSGFAIGPCS